MDADGYYEAAIPEPYIVLGLRLRPLSMGHLTLLHRIGSPYVTGSTEDGNVIGNLGVACLICSMTYGDGVAFLDLPDAGDVIAHWGRRLRRPHWWSREREIDWPAKQKLFSDYVRHSLELPGHSWIHDSGHTIDAPIVQLVRLQLQMKLHFTEAELMDRPWRLCLWDILTVRALEGDLRFIDTTEIDEAQLQANEFAARIKTGGVNASS